MSPPTYRKLGKLTDRMDTPSLQYYRRRVETEILNWEHGSWQEKILIAEQVLDVQREEEYPEVRSEEAL